MEIKTKISLRNLGTINKNLVEIGNLRLWFSYETIVAFEDNGVFHACENVWSRTTGKLLNEISNKQDRLKYVEFNEKLQEALNKHNLNE